MRLPTLDVIHLGCTRGDRPLFTDLSLSLRPGQLLLVNGSNGSGKTTLLRTLCGLSRPAAGEVRWNGTPIRELGDEYRAQLAHIGHLDGIQGELTPLENLRAYACLANDAERDNANDALARLGLAAFRDFPAKLLSQGQRRRLALARLLVAARTLWVLDEPFTALDARSCRLLEQLTREHVAQGGLVALSSHQEFALGGIDLVRVDLDAVHAASLAALATAESAALAARHS